ncbi:MAG: transposase [Clostridia bacterium]|nr:transposase [Clostridia bacterium]
MSNELPKRKRIRLQNYDYSSNGLYFVTICTEDKKPILSRVVGDDAHIVPKKIVLKSYGKVAEKYIRHINEVYDNISVENYIIMPNHIHLLIFIDEYKNGTMWASSPTKLGSVVRSFKTMVTKDVGFSIWQRSYYDEIIRDEKHFQSVWNYIEYNALKEYK